VKPQLRLLVSAVALAATALPATAQERQRSADRGATVQVFGTVLDLHTQRPVPRAEVVLRPSDGGEATRRAADGEGRFRFPPLAVGSYAIEIGALGYHAIRENLPVRDVAEVRLTVEMVPRALELDPVVVVTERLNRLDLVGFHDRRRTGLGRHLTREEFLALHPLYVSDALRMLPGVRVVPTGRFGNEVLLRRGCRPTVFVDGMRLASMEGFSIDHLLSTHDIEAIEVYHGMLAPAQFSAGSCGSIVVWTRQGERQPARGSFWRRVAFALGFAAVSFVLTR
jgi:hypothetical protein